MRAMSQVHWNSLANAPWLGAVLAVLLQACSGGSESGLELFKDGRYQQALPVLLVEAEQGRVTSRTALATQYYLGLGTPRDLPQAAHHFEIAARAGDALAQLNLGVLHLNGWGAKQSRTDAFGWFQAAADAGNARALDYLATLTDKLTPNQMTVSRDRVRALLDPKRAEADVPP